MWCMVYGVCYGVYCPYINLPALYDSRPSSCVGFIPVFKKSNSSQFSSLFVSKWAHACIIIELDNQWNTLLEY